MYWFGFRVWLTEPSLSKRSGSVLKLFKKKPVFLSMVSFDYGSNWFKWFIWTPLHSLYDFATPGMLVIGDWCKQFLFLFFLKKIFFLVAFYRVKDAAQNECHLYSWLNVSIIEVLKIVLISGLRIFWWYIETCKTFYSQTSHRLSCNRKVIMWRNIWIREHWFITQHCHFQDQIELCNG